MSAYQGTGAAVKLDIWPGRGIRSTTNAKMRILQLRSRQIDHRITVYKVRDLKVSPKPFLDLENHIKRP